MSHTATIIAQFAKLSVNVNGLVVPGRSVERVLARPAFNLVVYNDDGAFKVSLVGSATAVKFNGRFILLAAQHQLRGVDEQNVAMLTDNGSHVITCSGRRGFTPNTQTDAYDIVAFDFTEPCKGTP